ncbi:toll/interleukin-1 receptor domain-containing protein [Stenotrophomonas maltophilia]|uniref:toll/interleukin-1 receptor domain-containing protein n=1 Tax=Stenotrophomonas maltophilia TaxID=40324 RepID=UPI000DB67509|nr:toll/interleukin-1 receptor domain-containing protein [Stenotrophomonas maltophilia]PZS45748.1 hypothetical protein A7X57_13955 [Stenotrophomonas maltophilia]
MVKVFISWSGDHSKRYAEAIRDWLPGVIQMVKPYFTPQDIEKGARWSQDIANELGQSHVGIICVTRENLHSDWILFEAGALSKSLDQSHVCPLIFGISPTDLSGPLKQFQATTAEKSDFQRLVTLINGKLGESKLPPKTLEAVFEKWWPDLQAKIEQIASAQQAPAEPVRSERELVEEILTLTRSLHRGIGRGGVSPKAVLELLQNHMEIHEQQFLEIGGYQETLDILQKSRKALLHMARQFRGQLTDLDDLAKTLGELDYSMGDPSEENDIENLI